MNTCTLFSYRKRGHHKQELVCIITRIFHIHSLVYYFPLWSMLQRRSTNMLLTMNLVWAPAYSLTLKALLFLRQAIPHFPIYVRTDKWSLLHIIMFPLYHPLYMWSLFHMRSLFCTRIARTRK